MANAFSTLSSSASQPAESSPDATESSSDFLVVKSGSAFLGEGASSSDESDDANASIGLKGEEDAADAACASCDADKDDIALERVPG